MNYKCKAQFFLLNEDFYIIDIKKNMLCM